MPIELNSRGEFCNLMIGDGQRIGATRTTARYVKLNDVVPKEACSMNDFLAATVNAYSSWPKGNFAIRETVQEDV